MMRLQACAVLAICGLTAAALAAVQQAGSTTSARKAGEVVIERASLTTPETGKVDFELGTLYVPENRADPKS
ncbi:MAG TPA: hypothetical protein VNO14_01745, partial [Blastocatellia bacterium]|nr:hypothetical protein [Blastocatellia bacterium]